MLYATTVTSRLKLILVAVQRQAEHAGGIEPPSPVWTAGDLNPEPSRCKRAAPPIELAARIATEFTRSVATPRAASQIRTGVIELCRLTPCLSAKTA